MSFSGQQHSLEQISQHIPSDLPATHAQVLRTFLQAYYAEVSADDLQERDALDWFGAARMHYQLAQQRSPHTPLLRVYNPEFREHGWQAVHTVIEVINDDMPFLIDSVRMALQRLGLDIHLTIHPVLQVQRDAEGQLVSVSHDLDPPHESFIHFEVDQQSDPQRLQNIYATIEATLQDVRAAVEDWPKMEAQLAKIADEAASLAQLPAHEGVTAHAFLNWLAADNFTLVGYRAYDLVQDGQQEDGLRIVPDSGLGILRDSQGQTHSQSFLALPPEVRKLARSPRLLTLTKANARATIHRTGYLDYIGVKRFNHVGEVIGEHRFLGLYTASAYNASPQHIPLLQDKVNAVLARSGFVSNSHKAKTLLNILETYPRDELFEIEEDDLHRIAHGILQLQERQRVRLFMREDIYRRYVSCLVFAPRDNYNTEVRYKMQQVLQRAFPGGHIEATVMLSEAALARIHFIVRLRQAETLNLDVSALERALADACRRWEDDLHQALTDTHGEERGNQRFQRYQTAFPAAYREDNVARAAVDDLNHLETLHNEQDLAMTLYRPRDGEAQHIHLKLYSLHQPIALSRGLPILENMGVTVLDEHPYRITPYDSDAQWVSDFGLRLQTPEQLQHAASRQHFCETFAAVWRQEAENDELNRLVTCADLTVRQVSLLRAHARYLRQGTVNFSHAYLRACLVKHARVARWLVELFDARLNPTNHDAIRADALSGAIRDYLQTVDNVDEDRILSSLLAQVLATVRTNYYQTHVNGSPKAWLSFKFRSQQIPHLPEPRPLFEIFVYSPRMEGVHLRGAKVARGGLRWSDRMEDFRTEVLGLVKAQMVKNAVIVPMGSKGGFVCKQLPPPSAREAWLAEGIACYKMFISGLLDLTDNWQDGAVVPPEAVVRHDEDDPYLVVAADKGTATFSDIANQVAEDYNFWLGDAFASGGSAGYDHKKMGITARGAWEAVKRNFRQLGINTQTTPFTVVGVGDMSGDVFGNGMLLSPHIALVAAFDHRHIFLDPNPDVTLSFAERERLFALPRSSWADFNPACLSIGGGVFPRTAKHINLSPALQQCLDTKASSVTPDELIRIILQAPVDLLYNGGIGTYVKASTQAHSAANDRTNDAVRVDGKDLRAKVVAEGGNLGFTQLGRIEYALNGGLMFTDAIDNSAGVDCSDHEVNLKILLNTIVQSGDLTVKQRNALLVEMTDEVSHLVLRNNYLQTQTLRTNQASSSSMLNVHARFIQHLEKQGKLSRRLEFLPSEEILNERRSAKQGLSTPELAVLLAYSKISLNEALLHSSLPDDPAFAPVLAAYFPHALTTRFSERLASHPLKREIIANQVSNDVVNRMGSTFIFRLGEETGVSAEYIVRAWFVATEVFDTRQLRDQIEALDDVIPANVQTHLLLELRKLAERATRWILNLSKTPDVSSLINQFQTGVRNLLAQAETLLPDTDHPEIERQVQQLTQAGVPTPLATQMARADALVACLDIVQLSSKHQHSVTHVGELYYHIGGWLNLTWLQNAINRLPRDNRWQTLARIALRDDLYRLHSEVTEHAMLNSPQKAWLGEWVLRHRAAVKNVAQIFAELQTFQQQDLAMLSAAMREIRNHLLAS